MEKIGRLRPSKIFGLCLAFLCKGNLAAGCSLSNCVEKCGNDFFSSPQVRARPNDLKKMILKHQKWKLTSNGLVR